MMEFQSHSPDQVTALALQKGYKLLIFDFDGTLADTIVDVVLCFNEALRINGFPEWRFEDIKKLIGGNLETIVSRMIPESDRNRETIDRVKQTYRELYMVSEKPNSRPYPGVLDMLVAIQEENVLLAVNSNKGQKLLDAMVANMFGDFCFCAVIGYDEAFPSKPDPDGVNRILSSCGLNTEQALYIGDGNSDRETARNANMDFSLATWGTC